MSRIGRPTKAESIRRAENPICRDCGEKLVLSKNWSKSTARAKKYRCTQCKNMEGKIRKRKRKEQAIECLGGKCLDCGGVYVRDVYDFHHRDPAQKEMPLNQMFKLNWKKVKSEIDKCDLLCANCHRIRHYRERIAA